MQLPSVVPADGAERAIRAAHAIGRGLRAIGLEARAGVHTGEIELDATTSAA
ncbi:MAG: hypothetical protein ACRDGB_02995 [Candidatus Limnocylindria bacterium]